MVWGAGKFVVKTTRVWWEMVNGGFIQQRIVCLGLVITIAIYCSKSGVLGAIR